jgi:DNA-directed RNA polymerase alpha subunit
VTGIDNLTAERIGGATIKMNQYDQRESDLPVELSEPARRVLVGAGYTRLQQLTELSEAEVKQLHGIGPKALDQLRRALEAHGLSFASEK